MRLGAVAVLTVLAACEAKRREPSGIGKWRFTATVARDAQKVGICSKDTSSTGRAVIWCHTLPPIKVGDRTATVDLYFDGHADDGKLIEIQLGVRGCREEDLEAWLRRGFGPPRETRATRSYWQNSHLWIGALMPSEPGRCLVHVLPRSEQAEIARIQQK